MCGKGLWRSDYFDVLLVWLLHPHSPCFLWQRTTLDSQLSILLSKSATLPTRAHLSLGGLMIRSLATLFVCLFGAVSLLVSSPDSISDQARRLHFSSLVVDTHDDTTQRFFSSDFDLGKRNSTGHIDIPRMREGGMNAIFFSIWIDGRTMGPLAIQKALDQIDAVHQNVRKYSNDLALARTADDVRRAHDQGKIAVLMGIEGGHMLGNDIRMVRVYGDLGVRYMTLSHFYNDAWADSSTDKPAHNGLTDYGKEIVREMNRQGSEFTGRF